MTEARRNENDERNELIDRFLSPRLLPSELVPAERQDSPAFLIAIKKRTRLSLRYSVAQRAVASRRNSNLLNPL